MVWPSGLTSSDIQVPRVTSMGMSREGPGGFCTSHFGVSVAATAAGSATGAGAAWGSTGPGTGGAAIGETGSGVWAAAGQASASRATVVRKARFMVFIPGDCRTSRAAVGGRVLRRGDEHRRGR